MVKSYQICARCIMDTTDPEISFDELGICNHCRLYDQVVPNHLLKGEKAAAELRKIVDEIKHDSCNKEYDCLIGISGGVDSCYLAVRVKELGLRPLVLHVDNGWNTELAIKNIERLIKQLNFDLYTHVIDWEEFRDIQKAFIKAGTPDLEVPFDHAIFSAMRKVAHRHGIKYVLSGTNLSTETHLPAAWSYGHSDWKYIKSVHRLFGTRPIRTFPYRTRLEDYYFRFKLTWIEILNYMEYDKDKAKTILTEKYGWRDYGGKHFENAFTRFYQGYLLPKKFGFDKRRVHLSSLICSGKINREDALKELQSPPYPEEMQIQDLRYVCKKLEISETDFSDYLTKPHKSFWDYPSYSQIERSIPYILTRFLYRSSKYGLKNARIHLKEDWKKRSGKTSENRSPYLSGSALQN